VGIIIGGNDYLGALMQAALRGEDPGTYLQDLTRRAVNCTMTAVHRLMDATYTPSSVPTGVTNALRRSQHPAQTTTTTDNNNNNNNVNPQNSVAGSFSGASGGAAGSSSTSGLLLPATGPLRSVLVSSLPAVEVVPLVSDLAPPEVRAALQQALQAHNAGLAAAVGALAAATAGGTPAVGSFDLYTATLQVRTSGGMRWCVCVGGEGTSL
jgi:hypothetical protein